MKLGKAKPKLDPRTLILADYLKPSLPPAPPSTDWSGKVPAWGMMDNDSVGDCTCAAAGHLIMDWTSNDGTMVTPSDADILSAYSSITGYDPATGLNDNGAAELDVLNYWRSQGIAGHKIYAFASIKPGHVEHVKNSVWLFGGCYLGLALPLSAQGQDVWDVPAGGTTGDGEPGSWGGHAVPIVAYNATGPVCVTWGALKQMTWAFFASYCDEAYAILSGDWYSNRGEAPNGLDVELLQSDLKAVAG